MSTTPERRKIAADEIAKALESRRHAFVIHYACEHFSSPDHRVSAIAARNLGTGVTKCFEIEGELRRAGIDPVAASTGDLDQAERKVLDAFYAFIRGHKDHYWLHWNMRDSTFGFAALENRQKLLGGKISPIPDRFRVDLAARMIDLFGDRYADPRNRLRSLSERNGLAMPHLIDGQAQGDALVQRNFGLVTRSLLNRVDLMYSIAIKAAEGSLKTHAPWQDRVAGAGGIIKWLKEHPLVAAIAILGTVLGAILSAFKLWELVFGGG